MHARSTTIEAALSCVDAGIAYVRDEAMPVLQAVDGYVGVSLLVDREGGRCIATTAWDSAEAMLASEPLVAPIRARMAEVFGGPATVEEWEIAAVHRDHHSHEGACVRATWLQVAVGQADHCVEFYRASGLPPVTQFDGFCSASLLIDRASGRAVTSVAFDSREAMDRAREQARSLRVARLQELGADLVGVGEFELALARLGVSDIA